MLELLRHVAMTTDSVEERPEWTRRILAELDLVESRPDRIRDDSFKIVVFLLICCTGLANIGGVDAMAVLVCFCWEPPQEPNTNNVNEYVDPDRINFQQRQNYHHSYIRISYAPDGYQHKVDRQPRP